MNWPFAFVVACGEGSGVGQPSLSGVIDVAGDGVAPHGAQGMSLTLTPASGVPFASSTTVPLAFVVAALDADAVGDVAGALVGGTLPPVDPPPPPHAASAIAQTNAIARKRSCKAHTPVRAV